jgi:hypothetical protein
MQKASIYTVAVNILNKKLWAAVDKGAWHIKQILLEVIKPVSRTIHYYIVKLINLISNWEEKPQQ